MMMKIYSGASKLRVGAVFVATPSGGKDRGRICEPAAIFYFKYGPYAAIVRWKYVDLFFRAPHALSIGSNPGLKYKFTRIVFLKLVCYLMAKKWVEARRHSELVDRVEP